MSTKKLSDKEFEAKMRMLKKAFGDNYDTRGLHDAEYKAIPTGHDDLDCLLTKGARGIYLGGIIEIMGSEGSGKTSVALRIVHYAQKEGLYCCWIDAEAGFSPDLAMVNGVDVDALVRPELVKRGPTEDDIKLMNAAEVLEMAYQTIRSNVFGLVVIDSVAGLSAERVLQDNFDPNSIGVSEKARSMSEILPKIAHACELTQTSLILINQLRDQPGAYFNNPYHTPGGRAMRHLAQQRISVERKGGEAGKVIRVDDEGHKEVIGHYARTKIIKNKKAPPVPDGIQIEIPIYYQEYFPDDAKKIYDLARKLKVITIRNGILTWKKDNETMFQIEGEASVLAEIRERELVSILVADCIEAAESEGNKKLKHPVTVPHSLRELAAVEAPPKKVKKSKRTPDSTAKL